MTGACTAAATVFFSGTFEAFCDDSGGVGLLAATKWCMSCSKTDGEKSCNFSRKIKTTQLGYDVAVQEER